MNGEHWRSERDGTNHLFPSSGTSGRLSVLHETLPPALGVSTAILCQEQRPVLAQERVGLRWLRPDLIINRVLHAIVELVPGSETEDRCLWRSWEGGDGTVAGGGVSWGRVFAVFAILVEGPGEEVLQGDGSSCAAVMEGGCCGGSKGRARTWAGMVEEGGEVDLLPDLFHGSHAWVAWGRRGRVRILSVVVGVVVLWVVRNT